MSCSALGAVSGTASVADFVRVSGNHLALGDVDPWRAVGFNFWDMDAARVISGDVAGCYYQHANLDSYFDTAFRRIALDSHATAVRTFGFMRQYTGGANPDWSSTDKLLYYARKYNLRVIPVLGDQYGACGEGPKSPAWYHGGYAQPDAWGISYRDYAVAAVSRYRNDPTIAFWQLMNEAYVPASDPTALTDFATDMMRAIRIDAGDTNHLVSLGTIGANATTGSQLDAYRALMSCTGACPEIASAHYYGNEALQGMPAQSSLAAEIVINPANPQPVQTSYQNRTLLVDGWRDVTATISASPLIAPAKSWGVRVKGAASRRWSVQIDHVVVMTQAGPRVYDFESGTDGFTASNAWSVTQTAGDAGTGAGSLRVEIDDPSAGNIVVRGPEEQTGVLSVSLQLRLNFTAPLAQPLNGMALSSYLREATLTNGVPFVATELGAWDELIPVSSNGNTPDIASSCTVRGVNALRATRVPYSSPQRALVIDSMLSRQLDRDHASSGALLWDWKDPLQTVVTADGLPAIDPTLNCFTIMPGDPAEAVIMHYASLSKNPELDPPSALPADTRHFTGLPVAATVQSGAAFSIKARVTLGGSPLQGAPVAASGDCAATGVSDALGNVTLVCRINTIGLHTITVSGTPVCACPGSRIYTIEVV